jgi:O-acetyl-ADP-ribose deacetylase (regulator of RNase III)
MLGTLRAWLRRWHVKTLKPFGASPGPLRLTLGDRAAAVATALAVEFAEIDSIEVVEGDLLGLRADAIVSPANSFGDMSGGIDKAIDDFHRGEAQRLVREAIAGQFLGELPVGAALIVEVPARRLPFVVAAPTMRVPGDVSGTINAYLAMRAALVAVVRHNAAHPRRIRSLAVPGVGTGVGGMHPGEAARQMRTAYDNVIGERWRRVVHPALAPYAMRRERGL